MSERPMPEHQSFFERQKLKLAGLAAAATIGGMAEVTKQESDENFTQSSYDTRGMMTDVKTTLLQHHQDIIDDAVQRLENNIYSQTNSRDYAQYLLSEFRQSTNVYSFPPEIQVALSSAVEPYAIERLLNHPVFIEYLEAKGMPGYIDQSVTPEERQQIITEFLWGSGPRLASGRLPLGSTILDLVETVESNNGFGSTFVNDVVDRLSSIANR